MELVLSQEVQEGLDAARKKTIENSRRLRIQAGDAYFPVLRTWADGFALDAAAAPVLRGRVAIYDGARLRSFCLIIASEEADGELRFEYKRMTDAEQTQPVDFHRRSDAPVALLTAPETKIIEDR